MNIPDRPFLLGHAQDMKQCKGMGQFVLQCSMAHLCAIGLSGSQLLLGELLMDMLPHDFVFGQNLHGPLDFLSFVLFLIDELLQL
jgi:hypothetical protein